MMLCLKKYVYLTLIPLFFGCAKKFISPKEYISWYESKKCFYEKNIMTDSFQFQAKYLTPGYLALTNLKDSALTEERYRRQYIRYFDKYYFALVVYSNNEKRDVLRVGGVSDSIGKHRFLHLANNFQDDLWLFCGKDSLRCSAYKYHHDYGANFNTFILTFERLPSWENKTLKLTYKDKIFGVGSLTFKFKGNEFRRAPYFKI
jgi:hypothetical protein